LWLVTCRVSPSGIYAVINFKIIEIVNKLSKAMVIYNGALPSLSVPKHANQE